MMTLIEKIANWDGSRVSCVVTEDLKAKFQIQHASIILETNFNRVQI